jgi:hypothetical protein
MMTECNLTPKRTHLIVVKHECNSHSPEGNSIFLVFTLITLGILILESSTKIITNVKNIFVSLFFPSLSKFTR